MEQSAELKGQALHKWKYYKNTIERHSKRFPKLSNQMPGSEHNWKHFITQRLVGKFITEDITTFFYLDSKEDAETEIE